MAPERNRDLKHTFDHVALLYDQVRPGYPVAVFDDIVTLSGIPAGGRILEIGCGTGQATVPFAQRGYSILCVELGEQLAAVAQQNLAGYPTAAVHVGAFETWPTEPGVFDLVTSATAFHWVDPVVGYPKVAEILKPTGALAIFSNEQVQVAEDRGFFEAVQEVYRRETPELARTYQAGKVGGDEPWKQKLEATGLFDVIAQRRYLWTVEYDAERYTRLLDTYSDHRNLDASARERLFRGITELITTQYGGRVVKGYLTMLTVARRLNREHV